VVYLSVVSNTNVEVYKDTDVVGNCADMELATLM